MNKKVVVVVVVLVLVGAVVFAYLCTKHARENQLRALVYQRLVEVIDDFHQDIKKLSTVTAGAAAREELRAMKESASQAREKVEGSDKDAILIGGDDTMVLREGLAKAKKYLGGYGELANQGISKMVLDEKASAMLDAMGAYRLKTNQVGSPDEGDTSTAIEKASKLVKLATQGATTTLKPSTTTIVMVDSGRYWSNPAYADYHQVIRVIVANYSAGRRVLSRVLDHYDRGVLSSADNADWGRELVRRRALLNQLDAMEGAIPSGSVYDEHHHLLRGMLISAINAMEAFVNNQNVSTRRQLSAISRNNSAIMARLKRFYGIQ